MACCSEFQTECLKVITVGYLKRFVGSEIQDSSNGSSKIPSHRLGDTYCPTYSELTGGTLVQNWKAGTTPYTDTDGIIISGSYRGDQLVRQEDLSLKYTRFNTLSISRNGSGNMSECGDNATLKYTYNYNTYTKLMDDECSVSSTTETLSSNCNELVYHLTYGSVTNCTSYHINKNGSVSAASRTDSIYCDVTFRGTYHKSNTIRITQNALTGSYSVFDKNIITGCTATATTETSFNCDGGTYSAEGTGWYKVQSHWKDSCNLEYPSLTAITEENKSVPLDSKSGSFDKIKCPTTDCTNSASLDFSYGTYSASVSFTQSGTKTCEVCEDYNTYGSCNATEYVDECATAVTVGCYVDTTIHHKEWVDGVCTETSTSPGSPDYQTAEIIIPENATQAATSYTGSITTSKGGVINYTINQAAGPCDGCIEDTVTEIWTGTTISATACESADTVTIYGTRHITYENCDPKTEGISEDVEVVFGKNNTDKDASKVIHIAAQNVDVTVNQDAGPCDGCSGETITETWTGTTISATACETEKTVTIYGTRHITYENCAPEEKPLTNSVTVTFGENNTCEATSKTVHVDAQNVNVIVNQAAGPCRCLNPVTTYKIADIEIDCVAAAAHTVNTGYTATTTYSNCCDPTTETGNVDVIVSAVTCNSGSVITIQAGNTGTTVETAKPKITQKGGCVCPCVNPQTTVTFADVELQCSSAASSITSVVYTAVTRYDNCDPDTVVSSANVDIPAVSCNSGSVITIQSGNTGTTVETAKPKITQLGGCVCCTCDDLTVASTSESWTWNVKTPKYITISSASCVTHISLNTNNLTHFNAALENGKVSVSPSGDNTSGGDYVETFNVTYNGNCSSAITLTQTFKPCTCEDLGLNPSALTFTWEGGSRPKEVEIMSNPCVTNIQATCQGGTFFVYSISGNTIWVHTQENTSHVDIPGTLTVTYNENCSKTVDLLQKAQPVCSDFHFSDMQITDEQRIPTNIGMSFDLVKVTGPSYNDVASIRVTTTGNVTLVDRERSGTGQIFVVRFPTVSSPEVDTISFYYNGNVCKEYKIFRICPCGTDDCESNLGGGWVINNEINADSWVVGPNGETEFEYNGQMYPYRYLNTDTICCDYTKLSINGNPVGLSEYTNDDNGNIYHIGGWSETVGDVKIGCYYDANESNPYNRYKLTYTLNNNYTTYRRDYSIVFDVEPDTPLYSNSPIYSQLWPNVKVCTQFTVKIRQAPSGGHYDRHGCPENEYNVTSRILTPIPGHCWYDPQHTDCEDNRDVIAQNYENGLYDCLLPPFQTAIDPNIP